MAHEDGQQLELQWSERDVAAGIRDRTLGEVDHHPVVDIALLPLVARAAGAA
jgi:hypothetical protein